MNKYNKYLSEIELYIDNDPSYSVTIKRRIQKNNDVLWAVYCGSSALSRNGYFVYEPSPSNRSSDYLNETRYESIDAAILSFSNFLDNQDNHYNPFKVKYWKENFPKDLL